MSDEFAVGRHYERDTRPGPRAIARAMKRMQSTPVSCARCNGLASHIGADGDPICGQCYAGRRRRSVAHLERTLASIRRR
jgi:hypothetical protein